MGKMSLSQEISMVEGHGSSNPYVFYTPAISSLSSVLSGLPLQSTFTMAATPAARQITITAPSTMQPGQAATVQVQLTASGDETLPDVQLALQLPPGWTDVPVGATEFT